MGGRAGSAADAPAARVQLERVKLTDSSFVPSGMFIAPYMRQRAEPVP